MTTTTASDVLTRLDAESDVPVHAGVPQAQGDLIVLPADGRVPAATEPVPTAGVALLRGRGGHVHLLLGRVAWRPGSAREGAQTLGTLTVPAGETAWLAHGDGTPASALSRDADHAMLGIGVGTYVIRRQREQADVVALVAD